MHLIATFVLLFCAALCGQSQHHDTTYDQTHQEANRIHRHSAVGIQPLQGHLPVRLDYVLLGDVISPGPKCGGCAGATPEFKEGNGAWTNATVVPNTVLSTYEIQSATPLSGLASWSVSKDATTGVGGFGLILDDLRLTQNDGTCEYSDAETKCKNGESCGEQIQLFFTAYCKPGGPLDVPQPEIEITLPTGGASMQPRPTGVTDPNTGLMEYKCVTVMFVNPGCGQSKETEFDPSVMDPETEGYEHQWSQTSNIIKVKSTCEVCPEDPIT